MTFSYLYRWVPLKPDFLGSMKICLAYQLSNLWVIFYIKSYKEKFWQKIWAKQQSDLTAVQLKWAHLYYHTFVEIFYTLSCQAGGHIVHDVSTRKPLHYNFYTHQYRLRDMDFSVISTQNCRDKRILIPGPECISINLQFTERVRYLDFMISMCV